MAAQTLGEYLASSPSNVRSDLPLFLARSGERWRPSAAADVQRDVRELAAGLLSYGAEPGAPVAVYAESGPEALVADLAIQTFGGVSIPIPHDTNVPALVALLEQSRVRQVLVSGEGRLRHVLSVRPDLPLLDLVLLFEPPRDGEKLPAALVQTARAAGAARLAETPGFLESARGTDPSAIACRLPRSGLGLSGANLLHALRALEAVVDVGVGDVVVSLVPEHKAVHRTFQYLCFRRRATLAFAASEREIVEVRPTIVVGESVFVEGLARDLRARIASRSALARRLAAWALLKGSERARGALAEGRLPTERPWSFRFADRLALRQLRRESVGDRLRFLVSLGTPLALETRDFLLSAGVPVLEGYDLDEASGLVTLETPKTLRPGTAGLPVPGLELTIAETGELLVRGPMVAKAQSEEWARTGRNARLHPGGGLQPIS